MVKKWPENNNLASFSKVQSKSQNALKSINRRTFGSFQDKTTTEFHSNLSLVKSDLILTSSFSWKFVELFFVFFQIYLTSRRVKVAGDVNSCHTSASKCEEEFQRLTEEKSAQDLYLDKLSQDMEDLEQKCLDYDAQVND